MKEVKLRTEFRLIASLCSFLIIRAIVDIFRAPVFVIRHCSVEPCLFSTSTSEEPYLLLLF